MTCDFRRMKKNGVEMQKTGSLLLLLSRKWTKDGSK
jgi:hypothetical protein